MYLTQSNVIRGLSKEEYTILREMCRYSNNLYNAALYNIRQYYLQEKKFLKYEENCHVCKENENYGLLQIGVSQQTLKVADRSFKSFFNLIKKAKSGEYRFKGIKMPHYREKGGMFNPVLSTNVINIKDGFLTIPMGLEFSKLHGGRRFRIPFPDRLKDKTVKEVRICPVYNGRYFKIHYCYLQEKEPQYVSVDNVLAVDVGLENPATCVTNTSVMVCDTLSRRNPTPPRRAVRTWTISPSTIPNSRTREPSALSVSIVACISLPTAGCQRKT